MRAWRGRRDASRNLIRRHLHRSRRKVSIPRRLLHLLFGRIWERLGIADVLADFPEQVQQRA